MFLSIDYSDEFKWKYLKTHDIMLLFMDLYLKSKIMTKKHIVFSQTC